MPWQLHHGGHVGNMMGCDHPSFIQIGPLIRELQRFQHFAIWRPSAILNKNLVMRDPTHEVNYMVRSPCQNLVSIRYSPPEILRFYNFAILVGKCLITPPEPLNIVGRHLNPQKAHHWVTARHLSHKWLKSVQGFDLGGVSRKKV